MKELIPRRPMIFSMTMMPRRRTEWLRLVGVIMLFTLAAHLSISAIRDSMGVQANHPQWMLWLSSLIYTSLIVVAQVLSSDIANRYIPLRSRKAVVAHVIIQSASGVAAFLLARYLELLFTGACSIPSALLLAICSVTFVLSLIGNTSFYLRYYHRQMRAAEQAAIEAELRALRAQINPHFLFNTLNSIAALIRINPDQAEEVTEHLAELFRYSLRSTKTPLVRLEDELHSVEVYLRIEKARFGDRLNIVIDVPQSLRQASLPSLLLQPLVENAVKHGAANSSENCLLRVQAREVGGRIVLRVEDSGPGFGSVPAEVLFSRGTGLSNVRDRLELIFEREAQIQFEEHAVIITFPFVKRESTVETRANDASLSRA